MKQASVLVAFFLLAIPLAAQTPHQLADVHPPAPNPESYPGYPYYFVELDGTLYFNADDGIHGRELWATDGTESGTRMVADVCPGVCSGVPDWEGRVAGGRLFFGGRDPLHGEELWVTNGTSSGTRMVADLAPLEMSSGPRWLAALGDDVCFWAETPGHGWELWRSDGSAAGTTMVKEFQAGPEPTYFADLGWIVSVGDWLFLAADDGVHGREPWRSDGTTAGTMLLGDLEPSGSSIEAHQLLRGGSPAVLAHEGRVYFPAASPGHGEELWLSDGTPAGTDLVLDLVPGPVGSGPWNFVAFGDDVLFEATSPGKGAELHRTDGTAAGTQLVIDLDPGGAGGGFRPIGQLDDQWLFGGVDASGERELWKTDGTLGGTTLVRDIGSVAGGGLAWLPFGQVTEAIGGRLVFPAVDGSHGFEWWTTDGATTGTELLVDAEAGPASGYNPSLSPTLPARVGDSIVFFAKSAYGYEPWISDGAPDGTHLLADIHRQASSIPVEFPFLIHAVAAAGGGGRALFAADDGEHGLEPWQTDGTPPGTFLVRDLAPGEVTNIEGVFPNASSPFFFEGARDQVLFAASLPEGGGSSRQVLARTDGTSPGTESLEEVSVWKLARHRGLWYFQGWVQGQPEGYGLWQSDGTPGGTLPQWVGIGLAEIEPSANLLYLASRPIAGPAALLAFDPVGGQRVLHEFEGEGDCEGPSSLAADGRGGVFFAAWEAATGCELWHSAGTPYGTVRLTDLNPGPSSSVSGPYYPLYQPPLPPPIVAVSGRAFLAARDPDHGQELWTSDGTPEGTHRLGDLCPGPCSSAPRQLFAAGDGVYFVADDGHSGRELWWSDGSIGGTHRVADLAPGVDSSWAEPLVWADGELYFAAHNRFLGMELWKTRGRWWSTQLVGDLYPGPGSSSPGTAALACPYMVFSATNGVDGFEPWSVEVMDGVDVEVEDQVLRDGRFLTACRTLRLGGGSRVAYGARVQLTAGEAITLDDGFFVGSGARMTATLDDSLSP